jgi:hypothetical protein
MAGQNTPQTDSRITIRFGEKEADLREWLGQFAATYDMSKVIKLACYLLSGLEADEGLLALMSTIQAKKEPQQLTETSTKEQESTSELFATMMQEIATIKEAVLEQRTEPNPPSEESIPLSDSRRRRQQKRAPLTNPTLPEALFEPEPVAASGLDTSRERRRTGPPKVITPPEPIPVMDDEDINKQFWASIHAFGQEVRRGH